MGQQRGSPWLSWLVKWAIVTSLCVDPLMASPLQDKVANTLGPHQEEEEPLSGRDKPQVSLCPPSANKDKDTGP